MVGIKGKSGRKKGSKNKVVFKLKIRNNTNRKLALYIGNPNEEEPTAIVNLKVGEDFDLENFAEEISIQEDRKQEIEENRKTETAVEEKHNIENPIIA